MSDEKAKHGEEHLDLSQPKTPFEYVRLFFSGFAMGSADIVPGVSGGTMAFILGIYETLINAIKSFDLTAIRLALRFDLKGVLEHVPIRFLIALGLGIMTAILLLANLLHDLLENQPTFLFAFFAGLIVASIVAVGLKVKWTPAALGALIAGTVFAFVIVGIDTTGADPVGDLAYAVTHEGDVAVAEVTLLEAISEADNGVTDDAPGLVTSFIVALEAGEGAEAIEDVLDEAVYSPTNPLTLFVSGMIAICAMILPGISGSFILLILGQYATVLGAVKSLDIVTIGAVGAGAVVGIIAFSRILSWLLKHYYDVTVAALVGFMIGALRLIYTEAANGVSEVSDTGVLDGGQIALVAALIAVGFLLVSVLDHLQSGTNPVFAWFWKPVQPVDDIAQKAEVLQ